MDVDRWTESGLYDASADNAADRLALLEFLTEQGCDLEEMLEADARDRLFALAGDRIIRPSRPRFDSEAAAHELGTDSATVSAAWRAFGLPAPTESILGTQDLEAIRTWLVVTDLVGDEAASGLARVLGSGAARLAEAESSALRFGMAGQMDRAVTGSEAVTARVFAQVTALVPRIGAVLDAVHRHHLEAARRHFEEVLPGLDHSIRCGVGFADLSDFTPMSSAMPLSELSGLLARFEQVCADTVHEGGGRLVKFLGDAVMFVAPTADTLAGIACALVRHPKAEQACLKVRAGIAYGDLLAQDGDYFGPPVNLAARLQALAEPGQVLATPGVVPLLGPGFSAGEGEEREVRGFDVPIAPYRIERVSALDRSPG